MLIGSQFTFWLLNQWRYNQMQKLVLHRYVLNFSLGLCGLILFNDFYTYFSPLKSKKFALKPLMHYSWLLTLSSTFFSNFQMLSQLHSLNLKLCSQQYNKKFVLHLIVVPQLSSGWQHNYLTKTRQVGHTNEQSMYFLMSMEQVYPTW